MRETLALAGRHLRESVRSGGARIALLAFLVALPLVVAAPAGEAAGGTVLWAVSLALALLALALPAACGSTLPSDRASGREEWLAAHAPPGVARRLAAVLGPAAGVLLGTVLAGVLAAAAVVGSGRGRTLQGAEAVAVPEGTRLLAPRRTEAAPVRLALGSPAGGRLLEVEAKPLFASREAIHAGAGGELRLAWAAAGSSAEVSGPLRAPVRFALPPEAVEVTLENRTPGVHLVVRAAHLLDPVGRSPAPSLLWASLLLALVAAALVPSAVLVSRWTSAPTAVAVTAVLAVLGLVRPHLDDLEAGSRSGHHHHHGAEHADEGVLEERALGFLRVVSRVAPDLAGLSVLSEPSEGRALGAADLRRAGPPLLHGAVVLLLVLAPGLPRRRA